MTLFKYLPPHRLDVIRDHRIRFTPYHQQNDPFECRFIMEPLTHEAKSALADVFKAEWAEAEVWLKSHFARVGMLCLSRCERNVLMWSHYADSHRGFVVGFDVQHEFFHRDTSYMTQPYRVRETLKGPGFSSPRKVRYEKNRFNIHKEISEPWDGFFWKSHHWAYEQEERIFRSLDEADQDCDGIELFSLPPESIEMVILGADIKPETESEIRSTLALEHYHHVQLKQAHLGRRDFEISVGAVSDA